MNPLSRFVREKTGKYVVVVGHTRWRFIQGVGGWKTFDPVWQEYLRLSWKRSDEKDEQTADEALGYLDHAKSKVAYQDGGRRE